MSGTIFPSNLNLSSKKRIHSDLANLRLRLEELYLLGEAILERCDEIYKRDFNNLMSDLVMIKESALESSGIEVT